MKLHGTKAAADAFTFQSMSEHVDEVYGLLKQGDEHWKAEAVDIIIHGHVLLARYGVPPAEVGKLLGKRTARFKEKINAAGQTKNKKIKGK